MKKMDEMEEKFVEYWHDRMNEPMSLRPLTEEEFNKAKEKGYESGTYEEYLKAVQE